MKRKQRGGGEFHKGHDTGGRPAYGPAKPRWGERSERFGRDDRPPRGERSERFGGDDRPPRRTYHREGAVGGWSRPPWRDGPPSRSRSPEGFGEHAPSPVRLSHLPQPIAARKLKTGMKAAHQALAQLIEDFGQGICGPYDVSELEVTLSFDGEGRFLGIGAGGCASLKLTITPLEAESILEQDALSEPSNEGGINENFEEETPL